MSFRAVMTGITRISKESVFSDLNNLSVITTTSAAYNTCFGFTENEVFETLDAAGLADMKGPVKKWYDGFVFGGHRDIYNPWSITCFLKRRRLDTYWTSTSSNALISNTLESMAGKALRQIEDKKYDAELLDSGIEPDRIHHYGFTFEGKDVLIVGE